MRRIALVALLLLLNISFCADLDCKIGQMIITGFDGKSTKSRGFKRVLSDISKSKISGVILFSKNIKSYDELKKMIEKLRNASKIPPFIAIDNEGGEIQRYDFEKYKSAKEISQKSEIEAREEYSKMANLERDLGINFNFAPVLDLEINKKSIIAKKRRSYSSNPEIVSKYAKIFIEEHNKLNIITSMKHFPGHGSASGDTHKGFVDSTQTFLEDEIKPYYILRSLDKMNTVMVSHIFNSKFDEKYPASLSRATIKGLLKEKIGFSGLVVSDDFDMGAIRDNYSLDEIVAISLNAGVDIMIFSNNIKRKDKNISQKIINIVNEKVKEGVISEEDIDRSYRKIIELKRRLN